MTQSDGGHEMKLKEAGRPHSQEKQESLHKKQPTFASDRKLGNASPISDF